MVAREHVHLEQPVGQSGLLEHDRDFVAVGGRGEIDVEHRGRTSGHRQNLNPASTEMLRAGGSEERRGGKECVSTCRSRGSPDHYKEKKRMSQNVDLTMVDE